MRLAITCAGYYVSDQITLLNDFSIPTHFHESRLGLAIVSACLTSGFSWVIHPILTTGHFRRMVVPHTALAPILLNPFHFQMRDGKWELLLN